MAFFGGKPSPAGGDNRLPFIDGLVSGVSDEYGHLREVPIFAKIRIMRTAGGARNPKSSAMALFLQSLENDAAMDMKNGLEKRGLTPICLVFDGIYFDAPIAAMEGSILMEIVDNIFRTHGVKIHLKDLHGNVLHTAETSFAPSIQRQTDAWAEWGEYQESLMTPRYGKSHGAILTCVFRSF